ncbi:hypothetical protein BRADI_1g71624v3 [Brachypodium distachyon]|uniref:PUM-HD domain-containing protein n=2 Tax=Brachypodium distachyon TaxID=15368 RepID=A0A2K2DUM9_BRADI|nr:hypothetical protein BRADI_1g71624v3 [Brachypodium distachyon]
MRALCLGSQVAQQQQHQAALLQQQQQQRQYYPYYVAPPPASPPPPPRELQPLTQHLHITRSFWPQPQPQPDPWEASTSSPSGFRFVPQIGAYQSQSQSQSGASSSRQQQQPCTLSATASQYQPAFAPRPSSAASASSPSTNNAAQAQHLLRALSPNQQYQFPANAGPGPYQYPMMRPRGRTVEETLRLPDSPDRVVRLLQDGDGRTRQSVLHAVRSRVHAFMDSKEGHEVFIALLHACWERKQDLRAIVQAAVWPSSYGKASLLHPSKHEHYWEDSLKELITAVARYPNDPYLCQALLQGLLREGLMEHAKGEQMVKHCFATMDDEQSKILVGYALHHFNFLLKSSIGSKCLVACFENATGDELHTFKQFLLADAVNIATGEYSNYFVQHALEHGSNDGFRQGLIEQLMADVEHLSLNQYGSYVVEKCLKNTGLLPRVLLAFLRLHPEQLANLVMGKYANYVVQNLLRTISADPRFNSQTMMLARNIEMLPENVLENEYAKKVTKMSRKIVLSRGRHQYYG